MNNTFTNKNPKNLNSEKIDWNLIQIEMKNKLGLDIYGACPETSQVKKKKKNRSKFLHP